MRPRYFLPVVYVFLALATVSFRPVSLAANGPVADFAVHEWGTFTSIAGSEGKAVEWSPLDAASDLPGFVEHFRDNAFKGTLVGRIRLETPVMYFYARQKINVSVKVDFSKGLLTEWYPHATGVTPAASNQAVLFDEKFTAGSISWDSITLDPSLAPDFPRETTPSRYYAARATAATPLRITTDHGAETEKFLFYRGVSAFAPPIVATVAADEKIAVRAVTGQPIPEMILFERRGDKVGYRISAPLGSTSTLERPELTASVDSLENELRAMLVRQGLYADEACAMVATWHDSWFEEGSRLIYVVPPAFVDSILPLDIDPAPSHTIRVFVGRMELITPTTKQAVEAALRAQDGATLARYGRFLNPIFGDMVQHMDRPDAEALIRLFGSYVSHQRNSTLADAVHGF